MSPFTCGDVGAVLAFAWEFVLPEGLEVETGAAGGAAVVGLVGCLAAFGNPQAGLVGGAIDGAAFVREEDEAVDVGAFDFPVSLFALVTGAEADVEAAAVAATEDDPFFPFVPEAPTAFLSPPA
jgi:hypothetical protein